jgi:hypothetical protein
VLVGVFQLLRQTFRSSSGALQLTLVAGAVGQRLTGSILTVARTIDVISFLGIATPKER